MTSNQTKITILNQFQYFLGITITTLIFLSLIQSIFRDTYQILILLILIQLVISVYNFKTINIILEFIMLTLIGIALLPIVLIKIPVITFLITVITFIIKLIAIPIAYIDTIAFKGQTYFFNLNKVNIKKPNIKTPQFKKNKKKDFDFEDADFKEK